MIWGFLQFLVLLAVGTAILLGFLWIGLGVWNWVRRTIDRFKKQSVESEEKV